MYFLNIVWKLSLSPSVCSPIYIFLGPSVHVQVSKSIQSEGIILEVEAKKRFPKGRLRKILDDSPVSQLRTHVK